MSPPDPPLTAVEGLLPLLVSVAETPTWTNRDVVEFCLRFGLGVVVTAVAAIAAGIWALLRYLHAKRERDLEHENRFLQGQLKAMTEELGRMTQELDRWKSERLPRKAEFEEMRRRLGEVESHAQELAATLAQSADTGARKEEILRQMRESLGRLRVELGDYDRKLRASTNRVNRALKLEGLIWEEKVLHSVPAFGALGERQTPVVSVLNLKGGGCFWWTSTCKALSRGCSLRKISSSNSTRTACSSRIFSSGPPRTFAEQSWQVLPAAVR